MLDDGGGRFRRDTWKIDWKFLNFSLPDLKCERADPQKRRMLKEKFEKAESYLGRFISNILRHFTDEKKVEAVSTCGLIEFEFAWMILLLASL